MKYILANNIISVHTHGYFPFYSNRLYSICKQKSWLWPLDLTIHYGYQLLGEQHWFRGLHSIFKIYLFEKKKRLLKDNLRTYILYSSIHACISAFIEYLMKYCAGNSDSKVMRTDSILSRSFESAGVLSKDLGSSGTMSVLVANLGSNTNLQS